MVDVYADDGRHLIRRLLPGLDGVDRMAAMDAEFASILARGRGLIVTAHDGDTGHAVPWRVVTG